MAQEIERKFLVDHALWSSLEKPSGNIIKQGYLSKDINTTIRVRQLDDLAFLTIKGKNNGATRLEFEYPVPMEDALQLMSLCGNNYISKTRYCIVHQGHTWEVDVFEGNNKGLIVAEIELNAENETFVIPDWISEEVTEDARYYNANLIMHPFLEW